MSLRKKYGSQISKRGTEIKYVLEILHRVRETQMGTSPTLVAVSYHIIQTADTHIMEEILNMLDYRMLSQYLDITINELKNDLI